MYKLSEIFMFDYIEVSLMAEKISKHVEWVRDVL
jgi:hypothetical protein